MIILTFSFVLPSEDLKFNSSDINVLDLEWTVQFEDGHTELVHLQHSYNGEKGEIFIYSANIPEHLRNAIHIRIRSSMQKIQVYLNNGLVFDNDILKNDGPFYAPVSSTWYFIDLSVCDEGCEIKIVNSSEVRTMSGSLNEIYFGSRGDLKNDILLSNLLNLFFVFSIFIISILGFVVDFLLKNESKRLMHLNVFFMSISIWAFSELNVLQFVTGNRFILGSISYLLIPVMFISFIQFIKTVSLDKYEKLINWISLGYLLYFLFDILSAIFLNLNHFENMIYVVIYSIVVVIGLFFLILYDAFINHNYESMRYLAAISILIISTIFTIVRVLYNNIHDMADGMLICLFVFFIYLIYDTIQYLKRILRLEAEALYIKECCV